MVLANVAEQDWEIDHIDVKSAYVNAPLKEMVYMRLPHGVLKQGEDGKVLRLLKALCQGNLQSKRRQDSKRV